MYTFAWNILKSAGVYASWNMNWTLEECKRRRKKLWRRKQLELKVGLWLSGQVEVLEFLASRGRRRGLTPMCRTISCWQPRRGRARYIYRMW